MSALDGIWTTNDRQHIHVSDMGDRHLLNAYKMVVQANADAEDYLDDNADVSMPPFEGWELRFRQEILRRGLAIPEVGVNPFAAFTESEFVGRGDD